MGRGATAALGVAAVLGVVVLSPMPGGAAGQPTAGTASTLRHCDGVRPTIMGTAGSDRGGARVLGTAGRDVIAAGPGADVIEGRGGNDLICGGSGNDRIIAGPGRDTVRGERGSDRISGGKGADQINGGAGRDLLVGGSGADLVRGWVGFDRIFGGPGPDRLFGGPGADIVAGGAGADLIRGKRGDDRLLGGHGPDRIGGDQGDDLLVGGPATDECEGNGGRNVLRGCENTAGPTPRPEPVPPVARDDAFTDASGDANAIGNTTFKVGTPAGDGPEKRIAGSLLANDDAGTGSRAARAKRADGDPQVTAVQGGGLTNRPTDLGGEVDVNPDGTFTYLPPAGVSGSDDSFVYSISTDGGVGTAQVTIELDHMVWYADSSLPSGGNGTSSSPFNSLSPLNDPTGAGDDDGPGHTIFLYQGSSDASELNAYQDGITLEDSQRLVGEPQGLTLDGVDLVAADPGRADVTGRGIVLADGSFVAGVAAVGTDEGPAIDGTATDGSFTLVNPLVRSTSGTGGDGEGIRLSGLTSSPSITGVVTVSGATRGLVVEGSSAPIAVPAVDIEGSSDIALAIGGAVPNAAAIEIAGGDVSGNARSFLVEGGTADVTYSGTVGAGETNGDAGLVRGRSGGTVRLNGAIAADGDNDGLVVENNSGGLVDFNGPVDLATSRDGVLATDNGGATVRFDGGLDVDVDGTARGFVARSATGGSAGTIVISDTGPADETIVSAEGIALDVSSAAFTATLDSISTGAVTDGAVSLQDNTGFADLGVVNAVAVAGPQPALRAVDAGTVSTEPASAVSASQAPAVVVESTAGDFVFDSVTSVESPGDGVGVRELTGTFEVSTGGATATLAAGDGIALLDSPNGTFNLARADVVSAAGNGLRAEGGGELSIGGGSVATTTGTPVTIDGTSIGDAGVTFESVDGGLLGDGPATGILLNDTGAGDFAVTGDGFGDGGTIESATGDAVSTADVGGTVSLSGMRLIRPAGDGVKALRTDGVELASVSIEEFGQEGVDVDRPQEGSTTVTVTDSSIERGDPDASGEAIDLAAAGVSALTFEVAGSSFDSTAGALRVEQDQDATVEGRFGGPGAGDRNFVADQLSDADAVRLDGDGSGGSGSGALITTVENNLIAGAAPGHDDVDGIVITSAGPMADSPVDVSVTDNQIGANTAALDGQPVRVTTTQTGLGSGDGVNLLLEDNLLESAFDATTPTVELNGAHNGHLHATLFGNEITAETPGPGPPLSLEAATGPGFFTSYCVDLNGTGGGANTLENGALLDMDMGTYYLGFPPPDTAHADPVVEAVLAAANSGALIDADSTGTTGSFFARSAGCDRPRTP